MKLKQWQRMGITVGAIPIELIRRLSGWQYRVRGTYTHTRPDNPEHTCTVWDRWKYDSFTAAPNLRKENGQPSRAAQCHDKGWVTGQWDNGDPMTFEECNLMFRRILDSEGHPEKVVDLYEWGVTLDGTRWVGKLVNMRKAWQKKHGHP